MENKKRILLKI